MQQHEQPTGLTFGEYGYSLCYLVTPFQSVEGPAREFRSAFKQASSEYKATSEPNRDTSGFAFDTYVMTGLCDVLFVVRHNNFRFIHYLQNQLETVVATSSSWFHVLPYDSHASAALPDYSRGILFQVYIKSSLLPYRNPEATPLRCAESLAQELLALITRANSYGFRLGLYTTIGWADCLLWGSFSGTADDHWKFFQELERIGYAVGDDYHAFYQKRILLTGIPVLFDEGGTPRLPSYPGSKPAFSPLLVGRSKPGSVHYAAAELRQYARRMVNTSAADSDILLLDGKWDLLWPPAGERVALEDIASAVAHFATTDAVPKYIERLETHLLPNPISGEAETPVMLSRKVRPFVGARRAISRVGSR
jgi:hypothetical protein